MRLSGELWEFVWSAVGPAPQCLLGCVGVGKVWLVGAELEELTDWLFPTPGLWVLHLYTGMDAGALRLLAGISEGVSTFPVEEEMQEVLEQKLRGGI